MSSFSADWLALRESADVEARSPDLSRFVSEGIAAAPPLVIADLGSGTGSNMRYLSSRLPSPQRWRLADHDRGLLAVAAARHGEVETLEADLRQIDAALPTPCHLVTASALLDLVSGEWLVRLVEACHNRRAATLFALNYNGRITSIPADVDDGFVGDLVNRHQRTDKGLGPALGAESGRRAEQLLAAAGYEVRRVRSDWVLDTSYAELQRQLIQGWAEAARETCPSFASRIDAWAGRRLEHIAGGCSRIEVGHDDVGGVIR